MAHKIALTGVGPRVGKSTLAIHLEREYGFIRADHSRTLVEDFVRTWNNPLPYSEQITVERVYQEKGHWRQLLQQHSAVVGFSDPDRAGYWTRRTLQAWLEARPVHDVVFDPFRGEVQAQVMRDMGFFIVQLEIDESERRHRAELLGEDYQAMLDAMDARPDLEMGIDSPDIHLDGSIPTALQARIILRERHVLFDGKRIEFKG